MTSKNYCNTGSNPVEATHVLIKHVELIWFGINKPPSYDGLYPFGKDRVVR